MTIQLDNIGYCDVPAFLSDSVLKRQLYAIDPFFREGWEDILAHMPGNRQDILNKVTCVVFKPDAFAGRKVLPALQWLSDHGFEPIAFSEFTYNRNIIREDWRYQYNIATGNRIYLVDQLLMTAPSLFIILKADNFPSGFTASSYLKKLKGPSQPDQRVPGELRYDLGIVSTFINFIHTTDEPADIPRALSLYFPAAERLRLINCINSPEDAATALLQHVARCYENIPRHDLDFGNSIERIRKAVDEQAHLLNGEDRARVDALLAGMQRGDKDADWIGFFKLLRAKGVLVCIWDEVLVGAELVVPNFAEGKPILS